MSKLSEEIKFNETKDEKFKLYCGNCQKETNHIVLQSVDSSGSEEIFYHDNDPSQPETIDLSDHYQII